MKKNDKEKKMISELTLIYEGAVQDYADDHPNEWIAYVNEGVIATFPWEESMSHEDVSAEFKKLLPKLNKGDYSILDTGDPESREKSINDFFMLNAG